MTTIASNCRRCHTCGADLRYVNGEEWCRVCKTYRRYRSHGWSAAAADPNSERCPDWREIIIGRRDPRDGVVVEVGEEPLYPAGKHSYDFEWGYGGSGPAELAWAILCRVVGAAVAECCYQSFKWDVVAGLPWWGWMMTTSQVKDWVRRHLAQTDDPTAPELDIGRGRRFA